MHFCNFTKITQITFFAICKFPGWNIYTSNSLTACKRFRNMGTALSTPVIPVLVGPPGAGKSQVGHRLAHQENGKSNIEFMAEPLAEWTLMEPFNKNQERFASSFQLQVIQSEFNVSSKAIAKIKAGNSVVMERSVADALIFSELAFRSGYINFDELQNLKKLCDTFESFLPPHTFVYIYLTASASTLVQRVRNRARPGEEHFTEKTMTELNTLHDDLYSPDRDDVYTVCTEGKAIADVEVEVRSILESL